MAHVVLVQTHKEVQNRGALTSISGPVSLASLRWYVKQVDTENWSPRVCARRRDAKEIYRGALRRATETFAAALNFCESNDSMWRVESRFGGFRGDAPGFWVRLRDANVTPSVTLCSVFREVCSSIPQCVWSVSRAYVLTQTELKFKNFDFSRENY